MHKKEQPQLVHSTLNLKPENKINNAVRFIGKLEMQFGKAGRKLYISHLHTMPALIIGFSWHLMINVRHEGIFENRTADNLFP